METLRLILLFVHILGFAALFGGLVSQARDPEKRITAVVRDGAGTAFLAGLILVGVLEAGAGDVDLVILVLVMANVRKPRIPQGLWLGLLLLTLANIAVAVFWSPAHV